MTFGRPLFTVSKAAQILDPGHGVDDGVFKPSSISIMTPSAIAAPGKQRPLRTYGKRNRQPEDASTAPPPKRPRATPSTPKKKKARDDNDNDDDDAESCIVVALSPPPPTPSPPKSSILRYFKKTSSSGSDVNKNSSSPQSQSSFRTRSPEPLPLPEAAPSSPPTPPSVARSTESRPRSRRRLTTRPNIWLDRDADKSKSENVPPSAGRHDDTCPLHQDQQQHPRLALMEKSLNSVAAGNAAATCECQTGTKTQQQSLSAHDGATAKQHAVKRRPPPDKARTQQMTLNLSLRSTIVHCAECDTLYDTIDKKESRSHTRYHARHLAAQARARARAEEASDNDG